MRGIRLLQDRATTRFTSITVLTRESRVSRSVCSISMPPTASVGLAFNVEEIEGVHTHLLAFR